MNERLSVSSASPAASAVMRTVGPCVRDHELWHSGERLAVGLSGGKDSLTLTWLMSEAERFRLPVCRVVALHVPPPPWCSCAVPVDELRSQVSSPAGVELHILESDASRADSCDRCSRERRRRLFLACRDLDIKTLAFAHHQDDLVQTLLMNILFHGEVSATMLPMRTFGNGTLRLIRPFLTTPEKRIIALARRLGFLRTPTCSAAVSGPIQSQRTAVRTFLHQLGTRRDVVKANLARIARRFDDTDQHKEPASSDTEPS